MVKGRGNIHRLDDRATRRLLVDATHQFGDFDQGFALDPADPRIDAFIEGIVAFQIDVTEMSGVSKLAQDKGTEHSQLARRHLASKAEVEQ